MNWIEVKTHERRTLKWWFNEYKRDRINLQPGYQRRSNLWTRWKKAHLIDSIVNGFDVPKFYVADFTRASNNLREDAAEAYAVIDGKQRFEAIFGFMKGEFPLNPSAKYSVNPDVQIGGLDIHQLRDQHPDVVGRLETFEPVVMSVATSATGMIEELFVRLNSGVSINGAERRNAMPGPVPPIVREITVHPFFGEKVGFSVDRMQEFNLAAKILMFEFYGELRDTKARNLDAFVTEADRLTSPIVKAIDEAAALNKPSKVRNLTRQFEEAVAPYKAAEEAVMENLDRLLSIFNERDSLLKKQGAIPVYYWAVRNKAKTRRRRFHAFLSDFEPAVMENLRLARTHPDDADAELLAYYNAARTSNDRSSMELRYEILLDRFDDWRQV